MPHRARLQLELAVELGPLALPNPIVAASGTFGHGAELGALCDPSTLGAVTVKSIAAFPWPGNDGVAGHRGTRRRDAELRRPRRARDRRMARATTCRHCSRSAARVIVSIWGRTVEEYAAAAAPLQALADEPGVARGRGEPELPEPRGPPSCLRPRAAHDDGRARRGARRARRRVPDVRQAVAQRHRRARDRGRRARRGRRRAHTRQHGARTRDRRADRGALASGRAAGDCRARRSGRSRCARCTT